MKQYSLGDLIEIKHGYAFDGEHIIQEDNGIVLVTPGNFRIGGGFKEEKCKFFNGRIPSDFLFKGGEFIVTMTDLSKEIDTLGYSAHVPFSTTRKYLHNQRIGLVSFKNDECDPDYVYYLMQTHDYQRSIANTSTGATVHHTSPSKIQAYRFFAPGKDIQKKIAGILSNYDSLIDIDRKQIKLLEESAIRYFKHMFSGDLEDGGEYSLQDLAFFKRGKTITKEDTYPGTIPVVAGGLSPAYYHNMANTDAPVITVSASGANAGFTKLYFEKVWASDCSFVDSNTTQYLYFVYCLLKDKSKIINNLQKGAAQPHVYAKDLNALRFALPSEDSISKFEEWATPVFGQIAILEKQIRQLQQARSILIPRLYSNDPII